MVGWSAVALNLLVSCLWAFWGAIENFHEGWHHGHLGLNLLERAVARLEAGQSLPEDFPQ